MYIIDTIKNNKGKRRIYDIIFFAFLSSFIAAIENVMPRPIPYFRIGFSFIIIIIVMDSFNILELLLMIVIKNTAVALVFAYIFTPPFYLGITGGIVSVIFMKIFRFPPLQKVFSLLGVSIIGSFVSNFTQAYISKLLFELPSISILMLPLMILSLITGSVVGICAIFLRKNISTSI